MNYQEIGRKGGQATRGESKGTAKLTIQAVLEIRTSAEPCRTLAKRYNVHHSTISDARQGRGWKHV